MLPLAAKKECLPPFGWRYQQEMWPVASCYTKLFLMPKDRYWPSGASHPLKEANAIKSGSSCRERSIIQTTALRPPVILQHSRRDTGVLSRDRLMAFLQSLLRQGAISKMSSPIGKPRGTDTGGSSVVIVDRGPDS